jgi:hypothetical protein
VPPNEISNRLPSMSLEVLYGTLMLLGGGTRVEGAKIFSLSRFWVLLL